MYRILSRASAAALLLLTAGSAFAGVSDRLFDFNDAWYQRNGVNPLAINGRRNGIDGRSVLDNRPPFPLQQRGVRATLTLTAYNQSGAPQFWTVMGDVNASGFTANSAGRNAKAIADSMPLYVFPRRDQPNPVTLGANRQSDIADMRNGYFSNNPLGLWLHVWISYTDRAFNTTDGRKALDDLSRRNGLSLDGTPIIKTLSELENLLSKGYAQKTFRNQDGSQGPMYGICPVIKDPTNGGIAPDAFLADVRRADGTPLEPQFSRNFVSLQTTGRWAP